MIRSALNLISPRGPGARLSILIFHRVLPTIDPLFPDEPDAARFDKMMDWVKHWFNVVPLTEAVLQLQSGTLPERAAAITFDDGYADNRTVALPILQKHGLSATFFIATGFLDGGSMWNDTVIESVRRASTHTLDIRDLGLGIYPNGNPIEKRQAIESIIKQIKYMEIIQRAEVAEKISCLLGVRPPSDLMMTSSQVCEMHAQGMQIGAHTVSHPILSRIDTTEAAQEIMTSKIRLEQLISEQICLFAYPNGKPGEDYLPEHVMLARNLGFSAAVSTGWGVANCHSDLFQLPRFTPWDSRKTNFGIRLLKNYFI